MATLINGVLDSEGSTGAMIDVGPGGRELMWGANCDLLAVKNNSTIGTLLLHLSVPGRANWYPRESQLP